MEPDLISASISDGPRHARVCDLLRRYPDLSGDELDRLIEFYRTAPALDTALVSCDETVAPQQLKFLKDHDKALKCGFQAPLLPGVILLSTLTIVIAFIPGF